MKALCLSELSFPARNLNRSAVTPIRSLSTCISICRFERKLRGCSMYAFWKISELVYIRLPNISASSSKVVYEWIILYSQAWYGHRKYSRITALEETALCTIENSLSTCSSAWNQSDSMNRHSPHGFQATCIVKKIRSLPKCISICSFGRILRGCSKYAHRRIPGQESAELLRIRAF